MARPQSKKLKPHSQQLETIRQALQDGFELGIAAGIYLACALKLFPELQQVPQGFTERQWKKALRHRILNKIDMSNPGSNQESAVTLKLIDLAVSDPATYERVTDLAPRCDVNWHNDDHKDEC